MGGDFPIGKLLRQDIERQQKGAEMLPESVRVVSKSRYLRP